MGLFPFFFMDLFKDALGSQISLEQDFGKCQLPEAVLEGQSPLTLGTSW